MSTFYAKGGTRVDWDVRLRPAAEADALLLFTWANDPETRRRSFASEPIAWETHLAWLARRLADPDSHVFIGEVAGLAVGVVRFERRVISVTVAPEQRGKGYAARLISAGCARVGGTVVAEIQPDNLASIRAFRSAGFEQTGGDARCVRFIWSEHASIA